MALSDSIFRYLPHQCALCLCACDTYLCSSCSQSLPRTQQACRVCALPLIQDDSICGDCLKHPKPYRHTICPLLYRHPTDHLLRQFKARRPIVTAHALLPPLLADLENHYRDKPWPEVLIPIPIHWTKALTRGFNQAHVLSQLLTKATGIRTATLLSRPLRLHDQKTLQRQQRLSNLTRAFTCKTPLAGLHVAVVDDVITTCATAIAATQTLQRAGAGQVDIWALARTP